MLTIYERYDIEIILRSEMEMGNMSNLKRQQPIQREENSQRSPMGFQHSKKISHPETGFSWPLNKNVYWFSENGHHDIVSAMALHACPEC